MHAVLDRQVAARIVAECRDREALVRFQRASAIGEELLLDLGFAEVAKEIRKRRAEVGLIPRHAPLDESPLPAIPAAVDPPPPSEAFQLASEEPQRATHGVAELLGTRPKKNRRKQEAAG